MKIRSFAFVVKIFLILSVITNASGRMDYHSELKNKYNTFIKEIRKNNNFNETEKYEAEMVTKSIYSFSEEILTDDSSLYEPKLINWIDSERKFAGNNPDTQYFSFFLDPKADYTISGSMNNIVFLEITSYKKENGINRISNSITVTDKKDFSLKLSSDKKSIPDLELGKDDYIVIIRYYRNDYTIDNEKPKVLCIKEPKNKKTVDKNFRGKMAVELMESLYRSSEFLTEQIKPVVNKYDDDLDINNPFVSNLYPNKTVAYEGAFIDITDDSYLSISGKIDKNQYFIFLFYNQLWTTPFSEDVKFFNSNNLKTDKDGNYEIVVSTKPMNNVPNNMVISKLKRGIFSIRTFDHDFETPNIEIKRMK
ncbi:MAG: hypothetical protein KBA67_02230 [Leptotrichiaceae bacterium]|nr:hypothetical protein [Leptotrichiaceae bacterium]MBP6280945.1 hypothetical protein [Leptotrichiaceae bacterium]MBP7100328.1 hypothetical protein [Leptotrichiaceae bacterium]MBP7739751.1 hypothetical protein [Leptotrichiaceae bacterium]MBP9629909.1 hypothetical protein [Leptotrichiaceae bacterium]